MTGPATPRAGWWLRAAAVYNLVWGAWVVLFPGHYFTLVGMEPPRYVELWQCVGMIVGVYGVGYAVAARDPLRHWPIVLVGLLGKILGPIGFVQAIVNGSLPWAFGWTLLTNDLLWWAPFSWILWRAFSHASAPPPDPGQGALDAVEALRRTTSVDGRSVAALSEEAPRLLVFLRHFGCTFCREALADLSARRARIEADGTRLLIVHMGTPAEGREVLARYGLGDVDQVSDPSAGLYRAFRLGRGSFGQLFGWRSWVRGIVAGVLRGHGVGAPVGDGFRMPGVFLVHEGRVLREHRHRDAAEVPDYTELATCPTGVR